MPKQLDTLESDHELSIKTYTPAERKEIDEGGPQYQETLEIGDQEEEDIATEIIEELEEIEKERLADHLEEEFDEMDALYEEDVEDDPDTQFNMYDGSCKTKVDKVKNAMMRATFDQEPMWSIKPLPEFAKKNGMEICEDQQDFLQYKMETKIPIRSEMDNVFHNAVLKKGGILKWYHKIQREERVREETYHFKTIEIPNPQYDPAHDLLFPKVIKYNPKLDEFVLRYPEQKDSGFAKRIEAGEEVNIEVRYKETTYNDPCPESIDPKNFYVRKSCNGYEGLKEQKLIAEKREYTWWELKREEERPGGHFHNIDDLLYNDKGEKIPKGKFETYDIYECVFYWKRPGKKTEEKIVVWLYRQKKQIIGAIRYPLQAVESYYIPFYCGAGKGFWRNGIGKYMKYPDLVQSNLLNFILEGAWQRNTITPITPEDSEVDVQFLNKTWTHGLPLNARVGEVDFLQKYMPQMDIGGLIALRNVIQMRVDDKTGVSQGQSGRESSMDPDAPAKKTRDLLQRSDLDIQAYVERISPSLTACANIVLQIYYQMSKEGRKFRVRSERVIGNDMFRELSRDDMIARTNIQSKATSFDFDRLNHKRETLALHTTLRQDPMFTRRPESLYFLNKQLVKAWGPFWKNNVEQLLPTQEKFHEEQVMIATEALNMYIQQVKKTGEPADMNILLQLQEQFRKETYTPPDPKEVASRQKEAQGMPNV